MELRSRSRSKTPFQTESFIEAESFEGSNEAVVTRSTRKTTTRTTTVSGGSFEHVETSATKPSRTKSTKNAKRVASIFKTSDYSSEDGDFTDFDALSHISENEKNQIIEDAKAAANGTAAISALSLYRRAGRYWDKYPKTDYTYSRHSRDRVELAPGVVQMPNMSRRTIHSYDSSTNTDSYFDQFTSRSQNVKKRLFGGENNNSGDYYQIHRSSTQRRTITSTITSIFYATITTVFFCFFAAYHLVTSSTIWFTKKLHHLSSRLMLLDCWLLGKVEKERRIRIVVLLCLLPLMLLAGLHVLLASGVSLAPFCHPHCGRYISTYYNSFIKTASSIFISK